jgi:hypothetical protein
LTYFNKGIIFPSVKRAFAAGLIFTCVLIGGCLGEGTTTSHQDLATINIKDEIIPWEVVLKSASWDGPSVSINISITNRGQQPADFPYDGVSVSRSVDFIVVDSYNMIYLPEGNLDFDILCIYPGETRVFGILFNLNPNSGEAALYVTRYTGSQRLVLFDIGAPKG